MRWNLKEAGDCLRENQKELIERIRRGKYTPEMLLNILRRDVKDERVIQWIKRYLKSGVMENGVVMETKEGSPQGGNISPLPANVCLNEFDQEYEKQSGLCGGYCGNSGNSSVNY